MGVVLNFKKPTKKQISAEINIDDERLLSIKDSLSKIDKLIKEMKQVNSLKSKINKD